MIGGPTGADILSPDKGKLVGSPGCQPPRGQSWEHVRKKSEALIRAACWIRVIVTQSIPM